MISVQGKGIFDRLFHHIRGAHDVVKSAIWKLENIYTSRKDVGIEKKTHKITLDDALTPGMSFIKN